MKPDYFATLTSLRLKLPTWKGAPRKAEILMNKYEMADWILDYCVLERRCTAGDVAVIDWFKIPVSELQARSTVADMDLFFAGRDYALEQGWIEDGPRVGMIRLTTSGYQRATSP